MDSIDYGVCRLAVVPVRSEKSESAEQTTQLLFGDHYEVLEQSRDKAWLYIRIAADQFEGWLNANQHHSISKDYFDQVSHVDFKITTEVTSWILYKKNPLSIVMGSIVPISTSELFKMEEQFAFNGDSKSVGQRRDFEYLKSIAQRYLHAPYQWGGKSPFGIDAPGFVQMVFKIVGFALPRTTEQQMEHGRGVSTLHEAKPGDIVFFKESGDSAAHVGILLDEHRVIHSLGRVRIDQISAEGMLQTDIRPFTHELFSIRRVL